MASRKPSRSSKRDKKRSVSKNLDNPSNEFYATPGHSRDPELKSKVWEIVDETSDDIKVPIRGTVQEIKAKESESKKSSYVIAKPLRTKRRKKCLGTKNVDNLNKELPTVDTNKQPESDIGDSKLESEVWEMVDENSVSSSEGDSDGFVELDCDENKSDNLRAEVEEEWTFVPELKNQSSASTPLPPESELKFVSNYFAPNDSGSSIEVLPGGPGMSDISESEES